MSYIPTVSGNTATVDQEIGLDLTGKVGGLPFKTVRAAVVAATALASVTNPITIAIGPGIFSESPFDMAPYISVIGAGQDITILQTNDDGAHFVTGAPKSIISHLTIRGPKGNGFAGINHVTDDATPMTINYVNFECGWYGVWCHPSNSRAEFRAFFCAYSGSGGVNSMQNFMRASDYGHILTDGCIFDSNTSASVVQGFVVTGANAAGIFQRTFFDNPGATDAIFVDDGGNLRSPGSVFARCVNAIHMGPIGSSSKVHTVGVVIYDDGGITGKHLWAEPADPTAIVMYIGTGIATLFDINPAITRTTCAITDTSVGVAGVVTLGESWVGSQAESIPMGTLMRETASTGWISGGEITRQTQPSLYIDVAGGVGYINTGTGVNRIAWEPDTLLLEQEKEQWIYVNAAGEVKSSISEPSNVILLGAAYANSDSIDGLIVHHPPIANIAGLFHDWIEYTIGCLWKTGLAVTIHDAPSLKFDVGSGAYFHHVLTLQTTGQAPAQFFYWYLEGGAWKTVASTDIDANWYADGDGLSALTNVKYKKDAVYVAGTDGITEYHVVYGQETFDASIDAVNGPLPSPPAFFVEGAMVIAGIVVKGTDTFITSIVDHRPTLAGTSAGTTTSNIHAALSGLNADDHGQYALLGGNGARNPITGTFDFTGGNLILPVAAVPAQTAEGEIAWDSNDDHLTVGTGAARKTLINQGDSAGGDVGGTYPAALTVTDLTISGEAQGNMLYYNGSNWVRLPVGTVGQFLRTGGAAANPGWNAVGIRSSGSAFDVTLANTEVLTGEKNLTFTLNNVNRSINLGGDVTLAGPLTTVGANALSLTTTAPTSVTLPTSGTLINSTDSTLQLAYGNGPTITTASATPVTLNLTSGGLTINGPGTVAIGTDATTQTISIGTGAAPQTVSVGSTDSTSSLSLNSGTGAINIGTSVAKTITIGNTTGASAVVVNAGTGASSIAVTGAGTFALNAGTGAINLATNATDHSTLIGSGTGVSALTINSGTGTANIASNAADHTTVVGSGTGVSALTLNSGTGTANLASNATDHSTIIGSTTTVSATTIRAGTGTLTHTAGGAYDVNAVGAVTIDSSGSTIGIGADAVAQAINIGTGAAQRDITIGNVTGTSRTAINAGTGASAITVTGVGTFGLVAGTGAITLATNATDHATSVGSVTGVSPLTLSSGTGGINIGTAAVAKSIGIGTGAASQPISIGNTTGTSSVILQSGSEKVQINGITHYGTSATDPTPRGAGFQDGDSYYNTAMHMEMRYDSSRSKWLSVVTISYSFGANGNITANSYLPIGNGLTFASAVGYISRYNGTIIGMAFNRTDTDAATVEIYSGGVATGAELATSALNNSTNALNSDFVANADLSVRNKNGGNTVSNLFGAFYIKWRV